MANSVKAVTTRELRQNFKKYADEVADFGETVIVTRPENKNVVVISEEEYNSWQETDYLLKSKANRKALKESITQLDRDNPNNHLLTPEEFAGLAND